MPEKQIIKSNKLSWINIVNASEEEISYLKKKLKFNQLDLNDAYSHRHAQRPKINIRPHYLFIILLFPVYDRKNREIKPAEIDIFITKNHLITLHYNQLKPLKDFFKNCLNDKNEKDLYLNQSSAMLLYEILDRLYVSVFPMLDHISLNLNAIEKNLFRGKERQMVKEILVVKRNVVYFRKIMQTHKNVLKKFIAAKPPSQEKEETIFYQDIIDYTKNIWDLLENYQQAINALEDTNNALVTFKLNDIMTTLTIFSVIIFPLTLMAAIFGMNVIHMPIVGSNLDFWKILGIMLIITIGMFTYFKHKKWL